MSTNLQDAYIAVEHAYSMQLFPEALRLALELQPRIPSGSDDQLDLRLQLLIGHTYLYGLGRPQKALPCYEQVLKQSYDPTYRELAEQGVTLCQQAGASPIEAESPSTSSSATGTETATAFPSPDPAASSSASSGAAVPWLEDLSSLGTDKASTGSAQDEPGLAAAATGAQPWASDGPGPSDLVERIERIEPELVEVIEEPAPTPEPIGGLGSPQAFSPAEAAELAKGLLKVVLR